MNKKKKVYLLDLCCGIGGASMGYYRFCKDNNIDIDITGVDIEDKEDYPFDFVRDDAVNFLLNNKEFFSHIHTSPPCQLYSKSTIPQRRKGIQYSDLLPIIQNIIYNLPQRSVIENVPQAPIRPDIILRGDYFGLKVIRKRYFELINFFALRPILQQVKGSVKEGDFVSVFGKGAYKTNKVGVSRPKFAKDSVLNTWKYAMGIDWATKCHDLSEAIPPTYTYYLSNYFFTDIM